MYVLAIHTVYDISWNIIMPVDSFEVWLQWNRNMYTIISEEIITKYK